MSKILILGKNGMLGNYLMTFFTKEKYDVYGFDRSDFDILNITNQELFNILEKYNDINKQIILINAIGLVSQTNEKNANKYILINSIFPNVLSNICNHFNWKFIHPSTDCVFNGKIGNYNENDVCDETNIYGQSKILGEPKWGTTIRVSIIGEELTHKYSLLEWFKKNKNTHIKGYTNHYWNGITCLQYAKIIKKIIDYNLFWNGIRHLYSPKVVTKYDIGVIINDSYNLGINIEKFETINKCDKTLTTLYKNINDNFNIPTLDIQIKELVGYFEK
jgi:dTDP-4-dehydrorhamnose reductase